MKKSNKSITIAVLCLLAASVCIAVFSGYKLRESLEVYEEGDQSYEFLQEQVRNIGGVSSENTGAKLFDIPPVSIDFEMLKEVNEDAAAWLYGPGTVIDYPVMKAEDYSWYLNHLPDGTYNGNGTLFLDYNNPPDFSGRLNIIYGHHMRSKKMFGSLEGYKKQEYFDENPYLYLYTPQGNYRIDLKYGCVIKAGEWRDRAFMYEVNLDSLLSYASSMTTFKSDAGYSEDDKFIVLSTCSYEFDDARYIVIGVLRPEYAEGK